MPTSPFEQEFMRCTHSRVRSQRGRCFASIVAIQLSKVNHEEFRISYLWVKRSNRHKGYASECIEWLCELADAHNIKLSLCPLGDPEDHALTTIELTAWYQRYGFVRIGMQNEMMRYPNATTFHSTESVLRKGQQKEKHYHACAR